MKITKTNIDGLIIVEPEIFKDDRGSFFESWNVKKFKEIGVDDRFVQDNQSNSSKGILRGLHFQSPPYAQAKLVRVIRGSVLDVAVDLRSNSSTYGKHYSIVLSDKNFKSFYIPKGFAHGFVALEDNTIFSYKCSDMYNKENEGCLLWNDQDLGIDWDIDNPIISQKDMQGLSFKDFKSKFND
ncbi:MAG: dTDP-4-dehydrorhamnose 3,5-epimerase [Flavobacteriales bacterium]|nr:dTDP-4-dehydrorhamnose 3,5-epimerase [Flavobacteriales bacterium]